MSDLKTKKTKVKVAQTVPHGVSFVRELGTIKEFLLRKNGLTILYARIPNSLTVTTNIVYGVGSQHEMTGETGLAHMLEHMLFKPTSGKGVKWKDLEEKGAHLNATTWLDRTNYYFNMPQIYIDSMLAVEADRMRNTLLTNSEFSPERTNVLSEYEMYNSRAEMALEWNVVATAFQCHGYHHDTIGFKSDIESYTTEKLQRFYDQHYAPDNATLIVAGDLNESELLRLIVRHFGSIPKSAMSKDAITCTEPRQEGVRRVTLQRPTNLRLSTFAFKAPAHTSRDWLVLELGLLYLSHGEMSPLYRSLVTTGMATHIETHLFPTRDPFLAFIECYATEQTAYETIENTLRETLATVCKKPLPTGEIHALKEYLRAHDLYACDGGMRIALQLGEFVASGDWTKFVTHFNEVQSVTPNEIIQVLKQYLTFSCSTIGTLENSHA